MLVIRIEEWPGGSADHRRPIARIDIANRTGLAPVSDYEVVLRPTVGEPGDPAIVYGHRRADGWLPLARAALRAVDPNGGFYTSPTTQVPADVLAALPLAPYVSRACQTARAVLAAGPELDGLLAARGMERQAWAAEFFRSCRVTEKWTGMQCRDPQHGTAGADDAEADLTREELQALVDEQGLDLYRAQDVLAFISEMCDAADRDGTAVTTERVRGWLDYTGCGGVLTPIVLETPHAAFQRRQLERGLAMLAEGDAPDGTATPASTERSIADRPFEGAEIGITPGGQYAWRCNGGQGCEGWVGLGLSSEEAAWSEFQRHVSDEHAPASVAGAATPDHPDEVPLADWERELLDEAQSGTPIPGCDCGHEGMGASWHCDDCAWKTGPQ